MKVKIIIRLNGSEEINENSDNKQKWNGAFCCLQIWMRQKEKKAEENCWNYISYVKGSKIIHAMF